MAIAQSLYKPPPFLNYRKENSLGFQLGALLNTRYVVETHYKDNIQRGSLYMFSNLDKAVGFLKNERKIDTFKADDLDINLTNTNLGSFLQNKEKAIVLFNDRNDNRYTSFTKQKPVSTQQANVNYITTQGKKVKTVPYISKSEFLG